MAESRSRCAGAERADHRGDDERADQGARDRVVRDEQSGGRAGERQLGGPVHGEGHAPGDHERADEPAGDRDQCRGEQRVLGERLSEQEHDAHRRSWPPGGRPAGWARAVDAVRGVMVPGGVIAADDDDAAAHLDHVDLRAVQRAQRLAGHHLVGRARRPTVRRPDTARDRRTGGPG